MTSLEITGEAAKDLVEAVTGIFGPRIVIPVEEEGGKDESVRLLQMETDLHNVQPEPVQAMEGLGATHEKKPEAVEAIEKLIDDLRAHADWLIGRPILNEIPVNMLKAARLLEIELQRREYHDLGDSIKDREILRALEQIE